MYLSITLSKSDTDTDLSRFRIPKETTFLDLDRYICRMFGWQDSNDFEFIFEWDRMPVGAPGRRDAYDASRIFVISYQLDAVRYIRGRWDLKLYIALRLDDDPTPEVQYVYPIMLPEDGSWASLQNDLEIKKNKLQLKRTVLGKYRKNTVRDATDRMCGYEPNRRCPAIHSMDAYNSLAVYSTLKTPNDLYYDVYHRCVLQLESGGLDNLSVDDLIREPERYVFFREGGTTFRKGDFYPEEFLEILIEDGVIDESDRLAVTAAFKKGPIELHRYLTENDLFDQIIEYPSPFDENRAGYAIGLSGAYVDLDGAFYQECCQRSAKDPDDKPFFEDYEETYPASLGMVMQSNLDKELYMDLSDGMIYPVSPSDELYKKIAEDPFGYVGLRYPVSKENLHDELVWRLGIPLSDDPVMNLDAIGKQVIEITRVRAPVRTLLGWNDRDREDWDQDDWDEDYDYREY